MDAKKVTLWTLIIIIAATFIFVGFGKIIGIQQIADMMEAMHYSVAFTKALGVVQIASGVALFFRHTRAYASILLILIMTGAIGSLVASGQVSQIAIPIILIIMLKSIVLLDGSVKMSAQR